MNQPNAQALTLFDLLARSWQVPAPVSAVRFSADGSAVAFATADGAMLVAAAPDAEPPDSRVRISGDLGQMTLRPRTRQPTPLVSLGALADGPVPLATAGDDFLAGTGDGTVLRVVRGGSTEALFRLGSAVQALDHANGVTVAADHDGIRLAGHDHLSTRALAGIRAVALSADGTRVAVAGATDVLLLGGDEMVFPVAGAERLAWRGDGEWLAAALGPAGVALLGADGPVRLGDFPAPVRDISWSAPAHAFVAGGAFRIAAWDAATLPATDRPLVTGQPGLVVVEAVAAHPTRPLVAAGYANGQVVVARIGGRDELLLRQDGAAVTCLAFSPDGRELAIGDAGGTAAVVGFPSQMFK